MARENQIPSHPLPTLPLTYPLPTITFVTLEDRRQIMTPMALDHTSTPQDTRRNEGHGVQLDHKGHGGTGES